MAGVRRKPSKKGGNFQGYYRDYTGRRVYFTGTANRTDTKKIAEHLEAEHRQIALGVKPAPTAPARHRKRAFLEVVTEYVGWGRAFGRKDGKGWTAETAKRKDGYLRKWAETLSIERLADLDGILPRVEAVLQQCTEQGLSGSTRVARTKPLIAFCNWCVGHGYLRDNPLKNLSTIDSTPETERRALTGDEIHRLFAVSPQWRQLAYAVALTTGLRLSELRRLDRNDLDAANSRLCLRWRQTKNRKPAYCYLPAKLTEQLIGFADSGTPGRLYLKARTRRALPDSPLLFVPSHLLRLFDKDLVLAEIPKANDAGRLDFHGLRVAAVTLAVESGATVKEVQTMARHATSALTMNVYAKSRDPRMAALAERLGQNVPVLGLESATSVHLTDDTNKHDARKSLPEQALSLAQDEKGLYRLGTGPVATHTGQTNDTTATQPLQTGSVTPVAEGDARQNPNTSAHSKDTPERAKSAPGVQRECADLDPDLREVIDAWPDLPESVRRSVVHVVRSWVPPTADRRRADVLDSLKRAHEKP